MSWWRRTPTAVTATAQIVQGQGATPTKTSQSARSLYRTPDEWQREVWDFYDELGEFRQGVTWKANMLSRVRLRAAKIVPDQDEPLIVDTGPAHDIVRELGGGVGGQAAIMSSMAVYLSVPGECYLVGETQPNGKNNWYVRSIEEVRPSSTDASLMAVREGLNWRTLPNNSFVVRIHRPHKRWHYVADSPARAARPLLRELELVNRHIQAQYMSRLASSGIVIFPDDITFPIRPEFADEPDPFIAEWIEIAAEAVKTPGTAASVIPIPMRVPVEAVDKIRHIDFTLKLDDKIIDKRNSALSRLAIELDMPPEALLGTRDVNHWAAWLIDEQGVKIHIAPDTETVCDGFTVGYLRPRLIAQGVDPDEWVVWYDASELILRPDRSAAASEAYDRFELSSKSFRREHGFDESDKPTDEERREIILLKASAQPVNTYSALDELGYKTDHDTPVAAPRPPGESPPPGEDPNGPPSTDKQPGNQAKAKADEARRQKLMTQARLPHAVKIEFGKWTLLHPQECADHLFSCPVTHATWRPVVNALPGRSGTYAVWLNSFGQPIMGDAVTDLVDMIVGHVRDLPTVASVS